MKVSELLKLKRQQIIQLAVEAVKKYEAGFRPEFFDSVKVLSSNKRVVVSFRKKIEFIPLLAKKSISSVVVCFDESTENSSMTTSGGNGFGNAKVSEKLVNSIKKELGIKEIPEEEFWTIKEEALKYKIEALSYLTEAWFELDKITGKVSEKFHADLVPNPFESKLKEIK